MSQSAVCETKVGVLTFRTKRTYFTIPFFFPDEEKEDRQLRIIEARNSIRFA